MTVPWYGVLPFAMLLGCIATLPLIPQTKKLWHHNWFQLVVALFFGLPMASGCGPRETTTALSTPSSSTASSSRCCCRCTW